MTKIPVSLAKLLSTHMEIFVKTAVGATITLEVEPLDTIWDVKEKIQMKEGVPPGMQLLMYDTVYLEDNCTIDNYQIGM